MVTALACRWDLGASLYRETLDADLGVPPLIARELRLADLFKAAEYRQVAGDRFEKPVAGIPAGLVGAAHTTYNAAIDVLVPAYTSRPRQNVSVSPDLIVTEVPGLQFALARPPVELTLELRRIRGQYISARLLFPDEVSALTLKAFATTVRMKATDVIDVWRCLEICFAAGVDAAAFGHGIAAEGAAIIKQLFDHQSGHGMRTLTGQQRLNRGPANQRYTRIRALMARLLPPA